MEYEVAPDPVVAFGPAAGRRRAALAAADLRHARRACVLSLQALACAQDNTTSRSTYKRLPIVDRDLLLVRSEEPAWQLVPPEDPWQFLEVAGLLRVWNWGR